MNIILLGLGKIGFGIAQYLSSRSNINLTIIEQSAELVEKISNTLDVRVICGCPYSVKTLEQADAKNASHIIAISESDELNILACKVASSVFNIPKKIAWIKNLENLEHEDVNLLDSNNFAIDTIIKPEKTVSDVIHGVLDLPGVFDFFRLANGQLVVACLRCVKGADVINTPLNHLKGIFPDLDISILSVFRGGASFIPDGKSILLENDEVYFAVCEKYLAKTLEAFGHAIERPLSLIIYGGGRVAIELIKSIESYGGDIAITVVEENRPKAERLAEKFPDITILLGDTLDQSLISSYALSMSSAVITVTDDDKVNILGCALAKKNGASRAISVLNNWEYSKMANDIGIDCIINPRAITVSSVLGQISGSAICSTHTLRQEVGEVVEVMVDASCQYVGMKVANINVKNQIMISFILRAENLLVATDDFIVNVDDRLIVVAINEGIEKINKTIDSNGGVTDFFR